MPLPEKRKMDNVTPSDDDVLATATDPLNEGQTSSPSPSKRPKQFSNAAVIVSGGVPMQLSTRRQAAEPVSSVGISTSFYSSPDTSMFVASDSVVENSAATHIGGIENSTIEFHQRGHVSMPNENVSMTNHNATVVRDTRLGEKFNNAKTSHNAVTSSSGHLEPGTQVQTCLMAGRGMNGLVGTILSYNAKIGRYTVELDGKRKKGEKIMHLKTRNVKSMSLVVSNEKCGDGGMQAATHMITSSCANLGGIGKSSASMQQNQQPKSNQCHLPKKNVRSQRIVKMVCLLIGILVVIAFAHLSIKNNGSGTSSSLKEKEKVGEEQERQTVKDIVDDILQLHAEDTKDAYYKILGIESSVSHSDIKKAYRQRALLLHPDKCSLHNTVEAFRAVSDAYDVLNDPLARKRYDQRTYSNTPPSSTPSARNNRDRSKQERKKKWRGDYNGYENEYTYDDQRYASSKWRKYAKIPIFVCLIFVWFYFIREVFGRAPGDMREIDYLFDRIERELWRSGIFR